MDIYLTIILGLYLVTILFDYTMKFINLRYLNKHGAKIPPEFEGYIVGDLLKKTRDYTLENSQFEYFSSIFDNIILIVFLFGGLLNIYNSWVASIYSSFILTGLIFFFLLSMASSILDIPFDLYGTFKIENKYGFNTKTIKLWIIDFIKSLLISTIIFAIIGGIAFWIIKSNPDYWWLWLWGFFLIFSLFMIYISPYVIEPLFNKFTPIEEEEGLEDKIKEMMSTAGIKVSRVFKMDASKRSKHTNAYFTGIGKVKRIILYDTLLEKMTHNEILAILAHEVGHWKKKHLFKRIVVSEIVGFISIYISFKIIQSNILTDLFHIEIPTFFVKLVLLGFLGSIISFPFTPISAYFSRRHERQADRFACELTGETESLASSLIKLSKDNLSNLHPHPLFAKLYYSHPPVVNRVREIRGMKIVHPLGE